MSQNLRIARTVLLVVAISFVVQNAQPSQSCAQSGRGSAAIKNPAVKKAKASAKIKKAAKAFANGFARRVGAKKPFDRPIRPSSQPANARSSTNAQRPEPANSPRSQPSHYTSSAANGRFPGSNTRPRSNAIRSPSPIPAQPIAPGRQPSAQSAGKLNDASARGRSHYQKLPLKPRTDSVRSDPNNPGYSQLPPPPISVRYGQIPPRRPSDPTSVQNSQKSQYQKLPLKPRPENLRPSNSGYSTVPQNLRPTGNGYARIPPKPLPKPPQGVPARYSQIPPARKPSEPPPVRNADPYQKLPPRPRADSTRMDLKNPGYDRLPPPPSRTAQPNQYQPFTLPPSGGQASNPPKTAAPSKPITNQYDQLPREMRPGWIPNQRAPSSLTKSIMNSN